MIRSEQEVFKQIWSAEQLSRWEIHERLKMRPNTVGDAVAALLERGLIREQKPLSSMAGRPRVPLEIDPQRRHIVGVFIEAGRVEVGRLNLKGERNAQALYKTVKKGARLMPAVEQLLNNVLDDRSLAVGVSCPGPIAMEQGQTFLNAASHNGEAICLDPLRQVAGDRPITFDNDMHAMAARWSLTRQPPAHENSLLVHLDDGALGAAILINGRPLRAPMKGANDLGHARFFVDTQPCSCGQTGCLQKICSSKHLQQLTGNSDISILEIVETDLNDVSLKQILKYLARGIANAVKLLQPQQVILSGPLTHYEPFVMLLIKSIRAELLPVLAQGAGFERWQAAGLSPGENAAWLALASLLHDEW